MNILKVKKSITLLVGMMAITALGGIAQAETRFAVQDSTGTTDKMVVSDKGYVGIGNNITPVMPITIERPGTPGETSILFHNTGGLPYGKYNNPSFFFMRNNDVSVNNGLPSAGDQYGGDRLGSIDFGTITDTGAYKYGANISAFASSNWTNTANPGYLTFSTAWNSGNAAERMRLDKDGNLGIGTTAPSQKLEVNGGIRLNTTTVKQATCAAWLRGVMWFTQGGTGVADTLEICAKDANGVYAWRSLF